MVLICAAASMAGCSTTTGHAQAEGPGAKQAATTSDSLAQTQWRLTQWTAADGTERFQAAQADPPFTLVFLVHNRDYRVKGYSGCNDFSGTYQLQGGRLSFTLPSPGRTACSAPGKGEAEQAYLSALGQISTFTLDSGGAPRQMTLHARNGDILRFARGADVSTAR
jgi:heat shock protein HslJ